MHHAPLPPGAPRAAVEPGARLLAEQVAGRRGGRTICCAESFTAGLIGQALASVGSSGDWFDGSIVTYRSASKRTILGVSADSVISAACAEQMAQGAARLFSSGIAVASTGVAGPSEQDGRRPGTAVVAWVIDGVAGSRPLELDGEPEQVVAAGVRSALGELLLALSARV